MRKFFKAVREVLDKKVVSPEELILKQEKALRLIAVTSLILALMVAVPVITLIAFIFALGKGEGADLSFLLIFILVVSMLIFIFSVIILNILYTCFVIPRKYRGFLGSNYGDIHMLRYIHAQEQEKERQEPKHKKDHVPRTTMRQRKPE